MAAATAVGLAWRRRSKWEPDISDIPDAPGKVAAAFTAVLLGLLWYDEGLSLGLPALPTVTVTCMGIALGGLLAYVLLNATLLCEQEIAATTATTKKRKIIGGLWLTAQARVAHKTEPDVGTILKMAANNPNWVWPPVARGLSQVLLIIAYMMLVVGGSTALAAAGLLIQTRLS